MASLLLLFFMNTQPGRDKGRAGDPVIGHQRTRPDSSQRSDPTSIWENRRRKPVVATVVWFSGAGAWVLGKWVGGLVGLYYKCKCSVKTGQHLYFKC